MTGAGASLPQLGITGAHTGDTLVRVAFRSSTCSVNLKKTNFRDFIFLPVF